MWEDDSEMMRSEKRELVIKWYNMMPVNNKMHLKSLKAHMPKCQWPLVGGIMKVKKKQKKTQTKKVIFSRLFKLFTMYMDYFQSQEKSKNFKNAVYVVSIFIFFNG